MKKKGFTPEQIITTLYEAKVLIETWRREYNTIRPHSALNNLTPAAFAERMALTAPVRSERRLQS